MKSYCLLLVFIVMGCVSKTHTKSNVSFELPSGSKIWRSARITDFRGDYFAEVFAGNMSLHLRAYFDDKNKALRYAACLIVADDVAAKPVIKTWDDLVVTENGLVANNSNKPLFCPVVMQNGEHGVWTHGTVLKPNEPRANR